MNPLYFGSRDRLLFGAYHAPAKSKNAGVVLCHPWGQEYLRAHRSFQYLARLLAKNGLHVMRFDYYGSGDSAGESRETSLESWVSDVSSAIDDVKEMVGIRRVKLVGLRLGGSAAAIVASRRSDVDGLVLWDPIVDGPAYVAELCEMAGCEETANRDGTLDVAGFPLTLQLREELAALGERQLSASLPETLVLITQRAPGLMESPSLTGTTRSSITVEECAGPAPWSQADSFGSGGMPVEALRRIEAWLR
jgi:pimeloyl-ACP methyl ester carboxylesterase